MCTKFIVLFLLGVGCTLHGMNNSKQKKEIVIDVENLYQNAGLEKCENQSLLWIDKNDDIQTTVAGLQKRFNLRNRYLESLKKELKAYPEKKDKIKRLVLPSKKKGNGSVPLDVFQLLINVLQKKGDDDVKEKEAAQEKIKESKKTIKTKNWFLGLFGSGNVLTFLGTLGIVGMKIVEYYYPAPCKPQ